MLPRSPPLPFTQRTCFRLSVERIDLLQLGAGIAAAEVGNAQIGAQQVGTIAQQLRCIQLRRNSLIPTIFKKMQACSVVAHPYNRPISVRAPIIPQSHQYSNYFE